MKRCIIVLGMHRSGTSVMAGLLNIFGVYMGGNLLPANKNNSKGFYEHNDILRVNEDILDELGSSWDSCEELPVNWNRKNEMIKYKNQIKEIIIRDYGRLEIFALKEPRISILLPLYLEVFKELKIKPLFIIMKRNEIEIAESLKKGERIQLKHSLDLTKKYNLSIEKFARGYSKINVEYGELINNIAGLFNKIGTELGLSFRPYDDIRNEVENFLDPKLKHHNLRYSDYIYLLAGKIDEKSKEIDEKSKEIDEKSKEIDENSREILYKDNQLDILKFQNSSLNQKIQNIENSITWTLLMRVQKFIDLILSRNSFFGQKYYLGISKLGGSLNRNNSAKLTGSNRKKVQGIDKSSTKPLYVFLHFPKTAGTTMRKHFEKYYSNEEHIQAYLSDHDSQGPLSNKFPKSRNMDTNAFKSYLGSLTDNQKDKLKLISGHSVYYGLENFFPNREIRYFTFVRDPLKRLISLYNHIEELYSRLLKDNYSIGYIFLEHPVMKKVTIDGKLINFDDFLKLNFSKFGLMRFLLRNSGRKLNIGSVKEVIDDFFFIGQMESFDRDFKIVCSYLGIPSDYISENISKKSVNLGNNYLNIIKDQHYGFNEEYEVYDYARKKMLKNNSNEKVSIILPSFNYSWCISQSIDSVINQNYKNWELIIVDDGSKDDSLEVINDYVKKYPSRVKLFVHEDNKNNGLAETYKLGLKKSTGKYIAFIEADDLWKIDYLASKVEIFKKYPKVSLVFNDVEMFGDRKIISFRIDELNNSIYTVREKNRSFSAYSYLKASNIIPTFSCCMVRADSIFTKDFLKSRGVWLDRYLWSLISLRGKFYFQNKKNTLWRLHKNSYFKLSGDDPLNPLNNIDIKKSVVSDIHFLQQEVKDG